MSELPVEHPEKFRKRVREKFERRRRRKGGGAEPSMPGPITIIGAYDLSWSPLGERVVVLPDGRVIRLPTVPYF